VVNKLTGEAVEGAASGMTDLPKELSAVLPPAAELVEAVHRLDIPVTGCALFALTKSALSFLNSVFAEENSPVEKYYWAILEKPTEYPPESGELIHYIETNSNKNKSFAYKDNAPGRKKAVLRYKIKGDLKYGAKRSEKDGGIRLHARSLVFPDPLNKNEKITVTADPPVLDNLWLSFLKPPSSSV
jgi:23S rRNA pseudouridine1911/1915/1917 synthase